MTLLSVKSSAGSVDWLEKVVWLAADCQQLSRMCRMSPMSRTDCPGYRAAIIPVGTGRCARCRLLTPGRPHLSPTHCFNNERRWSNVSLSHAARGPSDEPDLPSGGVCRLTKPFAG